VAEGALASPVKTDTNQHVAVTELDSYRACGEEDNAAFTTKFPHRGIHGLVSRVCPAALIRCGQGWQVPVARRFDCDG
jgi:hypothetical protein